MADGRFDATLPLWFVFHRELGVIFSIAMPAFFRRFDNSISEFNIIVAPVSKIKCSLEVFVELKLAIKISFEFVSVMGKDSEQ